MRKTKTLALHPQVSGAVKLKDVVHRLVVRSYAQNNIKDLDVCVRCGIAPANLSQFRKLGHNIRADVQQELYEAYTGMPLVVEDTREAYIEQINRMMERHNIHSSELD